jgi:hypothetical protein
MLALTAAASVCCLLSFIADSILNWTTGAGTARYHVLHLLIREFHVGDALVDTRSAGGDDGVFAQGFVTVPGNERKVLLVNTKSSGRSVDVDGAAGGVMATIDEATGEHPARREKLTGNSVNLTPFAVSVITMPSMHHSATLHVD